MTRFGPKVPRTYTHTLCLLYTVMEEARMSPMRQDTIFNVQPPGDILNETDSSAAAGSAPIASASAAVRYKFVSSGTGLPSSKTCVRFGRIRVEYA